MWDVPSKATSLLVSNPSPKHTPTGYIFHGLSIVLNSPPKTFTSGPPPSILNVSYTCSCSPLSPLPSTSLSPPFPSQFPSQFPTNPAGLSSPALSQFPPCPSSSPCPYLSLNKPSILFHRPHKIHAFATPRSKMTPADTEVPITPPTCWKDEKRDSRAPDVAATTIHVIITIVEWPRLK